MNNIEFTPQSIEKYILDELKDNKDFLFNELDLQMFVARALEKEFSENILAEKKRFSWERMREHVENLWESM